MGILLFIGLIAGLTYAYITWRSNDVIVSGNTECFNILYTKGKTITNENVILFDKNKIINGSNITIKNGMALTNVTAYIDNSCNVTAKLNISLNVTDLNPAYISGNSIGAFKYVLASYDPTLYTDIDTQSLVGESFEILTQGSITDNGEINLGDQSLTKTEKGFLLIFYIDGDLAMNDAANSTFTATISGTAIQTG